LRLFSRFGRRRRGVLAAQAVELEQRGPLGGDVAGPRRTLPGRLENRGSRQDRRQVCAV